MHLTTEDKLILASVKIHPSTEELEKINNLLTKVADWDHFAGKIIERGIAPLLFKKLPLLSNAAVIPPAVVSKLQQAYYRTLTRSMVLYDAFGKIAPAFNEEGIDLMVLKGIYLSEFLYQDIGLRQCSDIDIMVKPEDGERSLAVLASLGFKTGGDSGNDFVAQNMEIIHYEPMVLNGVAIEVHIKLHRDIEKYRMEVDELWKNAVPATVYKNKVYSPDFNDLFIHVCLHLDRHFRQGQIAFTGYNDIVNLLSFPLDWGRFVERCKQFNCVDTVFVHLLMANKYMNAELPDAILKTYKPLLSVKDENTFKKYLNGHVGFISGVPNHMSSLKVLDRPIDKFRFFLGIIFPPKSFMVNKYNISAKRLTISDKYKPELRLFWWLWYPYRWLHGLKGMIQMLKRR